MPKYRKKPVVVEAVQFNLNEDALLNLKNLMNVKEIDINCKTIQPIISIKTLEGTMIANIGDYIIKGIQGELYPCKPDIFEATYEAIE